MENTKLALGKRIRELRVQKGLTQEKFAELLGIDQRSVSNIECGNTFPSKTLFKIAEVLEIRLKDLFDFEYLTLSDSQMIEKIQAKISKLPPEYLKLLFRFVDIL